MDSKSIGLLLVGGGLLLVVLGGLYMVGALNWFGRLPGDIRINRGNTKVFAPFASMILLSIVLSVVLNLLRRFL